MSSSDFQALPPVTNNPLPLKPPFAFTGLSARVFPLRANLDALQRLCNSYYNIAPPEVGRFRAVVPYVYLMMLDYGQLSELLTNLGWFAQQELFFCAPVEWYKVVKGKWVFHDWAVITPYIYVDDDLSVPLGRTVYGWPKTIARVTPAPSDWLRDPVARVTLARVVTSVFPELYQGRRMESRTFLEVERDAPMSNLRMPADARSPIAPWVVATHLAQAMAGVGRDALGLAQSMRIFNPNPGTNPAFITEMLQRMAPAFAPGGSGMISNSLNLKQFRQSEDPSRICYQALTNGRLQTTEFNGGGLLGEERTLLGDMSGGYTIKLHEYPSLAITETLGLEVHQRWRGDGADVISLKPLMPFWYNVNMAYLEGTNLAWRTRDGIWRHESGTVIASTGEPSAASASTRFNSSVGSAVDAVAGPFQFMGTTIRVLPLLAHRKRLAEFLDTYINSAIKDPVEDQEVRLSLWSRPATNVSDGGVEIGGDLAYVYMTASSFGSVTSKTNNIGDWAKYELAFLIPVKWERRGADGAWELEGVGLVPAYSFVDDTTAAVARAEVLGIPTSRAMFVRPESVWMLEGEQDLEVKQTLLRVDAEVIPALGEGQQAAMHPVVEISVRDYEAGTAELESRDTPREWSEILRLELGTKKAIKAQFPQASKVARALALELLGNETPISLYTLKQFRDVVDPDKACYQSLVRVSRVFKELFEVREIEQTIRVRIHDYPTLKLVESLGILAKTIHEEGTGIIYATQAIRPFYIRATIDEPLGERLLSRAGTLPWELGESPFRSILSDDQPPITVDGKAEKLQDQADPCRMSALARQSAERRLTDGRWNQSSQVIPKEAARAALGHVDPQMVIESLLSREWGNCDENARWRRGRRELVKSYDVLLSSGRAPESAGAEATLYAGVWGDMNARPGSPILGDVVTEMIRRLYEFTKARLEMEERFSVLAAWSIAQSYGARSSEFAFATPQPEALPDEIIGLLAAVKAIAALDVIGEPSPHNNLDTRVGGDYTRLHELLDGPLATVSKMLTSTATTSKDTAESAGWKNQGVHLAWLHLEQFREAVQLARKYCDVQREALLNKLARGYQKPDFCIKRDAVGPECDSLLPTTLSWDDDWYFGKDIDLPDRE